MPDQAAYDAATARVSAGNATAEDIRLAERQASNAGSWGGQARAALEREKQRRK